MALRSLTGSVGAGAAIHPDREVCQEKQVDLKGNCFGLRWVLFALSFLGIPWGLPWLVVYKNIEARKEVWV